jgi:phytoene desaturase
MSHQVIVIGSGFAGLSAATSLAHAGLKVLLLEKNAEPGGRARMMETDGFRFDMGPSWYWMPDVFEDYFARFGKKPSDYYNLVRLDPSYRVFFGKDDTVDLPAGTDAVANLFESMEPGAGAKLRSFLKEAEFKYRVGMSDMVHRPSLSFAEFLDRKVIANAPGLHLFRSFSTYIKKYFKNERILRLLEFPVLFLGAKPEKTPALYSIMNYADIDGGTWYPMGGMNEIVRAMVALAEEKGVEIQCSAPAEKILTEGNRATGVRLANGEELRADVVISGADYHHTESALTPGEKRNYSEAYWDKRVLAPSSLLYYIGVNRRVAGLLHHNLFFDESLAVHAVDIYDKPAWPDKPLFYVCCPSKTDASVAPGGMENLFVLIPVSPELHDTPEVRERYYQIVMDRLQMHLGTDLRPDVAYRRDFARSEFISDYNSFKGNAYGLANTLRQTAFLKPKLKNKHLRNLYYTGQLTTPGPGVPPSIISGLVVAKLALNEQFKLQTA